MRSLLVVLPGLALVLAACGTGEKPAPHSRPLLVLMGTDVDSLDPHIPFDDVSSAVLSNIYDTLVRFDGSVSLRPGLALRWTNPDDVTWRFFLDPAARFSDGRPLRAADVKFSLERARSLAGSGVADLLRPVDDVEVVDDRTVDVRTAGPAAILGGLAFVPIAARDTGDPSRLIGTGPYRLDRWVHGEVITLEVNPHHQPPPLARRVEFRFSTRSDFVKDASLLHPDLGLFFGYDSVETLEGRPVHGLRLVASQGFYVVYVSFNLRSRIPGASRPNPLSDLRVRQALARATDRQSIAKQGLSGFGRPASQLVAPQVFGFDPALAAPPDDPAEARRLLARAGYADLELPLLSSDRSSHRIETALADSWKRAGVHASLRVVPDAAFQKALDDGRFTAVVQAWGCTSGDAGEILAYLLHTRRPGGEYGSENPTGFSSPEIDALAANNLAVLEPRRRQSLLQTALDRASESLPYLPLVVRDDLYLVSDAVRFEPRTDGRIALDQIRIR